MTILAKNPVREAFAGCSTSNNYYETKGHALRAFGDVLNACGLHLDYDYPADYNGNEGRTHHPVCDDCGNEVGCAVFSYYRMPSGNYEFIGYLA